MGNEMSYPRDHEEPRTIKPLPPVDTDLEVAQSDESFDHAGKGAWNIRAQLRMLQDIDHQPIEWRDWADKCAGYIDGKQLTPEQMEAMRQEGMADVRPTNLIARTIRSVCGQEAKVRSGVKIECDDDEGADVSEVFNQQMTEARREAKVDMAVADAYRFQMGIGIGWVKVDRDPDPLNYAYRVRMRDRRNIWWDWTSKDNLLKDARWLVDIEWADLDEMCAAMPQHSKLLKNLANGWNEFVFEPVPTRDVVNLTSAFADYRTFGTYRRRDEWFDASRKRIKTYGVWYRIPAQAIVLQLSPTRRVLYDERNQSHINAVVSGKARVFKSITSQVRCALYAGPCRLYDHGTKMRGFPYVPFFGYRDDQDGTPYGLVDGMIGPQDEYNARRLRINWMLRARQLFIDNDALDERANTLEQVADAIMRPDLKVVLNANRKYQDAFRVSQNLSMQKEQIEVMQDAKQNLQDVPGYYGSNLGDAPTGVTSGIANSLLIEQGNVSMGDLNDAYRDARQAVHERLLDLMIEDYSGVNMQVKIGRGSARRVVVLNASSEDGEIINGVSDVALRVGLGDQPNSPAYLMMQQQQVGAVIQAVAKVAPQAASVMLPSYIESTTLPDRMELADNVRRAIGMPTAGDKAAAEQHQREQAEMAALQKAGAKLGLEKEAATVEKVKSETELNNAKTHQIGFEEAVQLGEQERGDVDRATDRASAANDPVAEKRSRIAGAISEAKGGVQRAIPAR